MKNKTVFRVGDTIKVINPEIVVRVGYPLTIQSIQESFTDKEKESIIELLKGFGMPYLDGPDIDNLNGSFQKSYSQIFYDVSYKLARYRLEQKRWGGKEKKIYTEIHSEFLGKEFYVCKKRIAKTGIYNDSYQSSGSYYDPPEYDPPYLSNVKSHILLMFLNGLETYEIESINVEKV